jgi:protoheme ferro-lyase
MPTEAEILENTRGMSSREKAAAISHAIYILAGESTPGWQVRVPASWGNLSAEAKEINLKTIDVWVKNEKLVDAWIDAINSLRQK